MNRWYQTFSSYNCRQLNRQHNTKNKHFKIWLRIHLIDRNTFRNIYVHFGSIGFQFFIFATVRVFLCIYKINIYYISIYIYLPGSCIFFYLCMDLFIWIYGSCKIFSVYKRFSIVINVSFEHHLISYEWRYLLRLFISIQIEIQMNQK